MSKQAPAVRSIVAIEPAALQKESAAAFLGFSVSTFEHHERTDSTFPQAIALSAQLNGYLVDELRAWLAARPRANRLPPKAAGSGKRPVLPQPAAE